AAWPGRLLDIDGADCEVDPSERPGAILGVSDHCVHLLSRFGVLSFDFAQLIDPHSPTRGLLRFGVRDGDSIIDVRIGMARAVALAEQLKDARRRRIAESQAKVEVSGVAPAVSSVRRPVTKRRADAS